MPLFPLMKEIPPYRPAATASIAVSSMRPQEQNRSAIPSMTAATPLLSGKVRLNFHALRPRRLPSSPSTPPPVAILASTRPTRNTIRHATSRDCEIQHQSGYFPPLRSRHVVLEQFHEQSHVEPTLQPTPQIGRSQT